MKMKSLIAAAGISMLTLVAAPAAQAWELLGSRTVTLGVDRDVVNVVGKDKHTQFRMCVNRAGVRVRDLDIRYANGGHQDVAVRSFFAPGTCTRVVDLKGKKRNIRRVVVWYNRISPGRLPVVTFWAR